jgi:methionine-rich copper-binding protein CopC
MRFLPLSLAAIAVALTVVLSPAAPASAHARYESSTPSKGEVLATGPAEIEITFTQEIQKIDGTYSIDVVKDRGLSVTAGPAVVNDDDRRKLSVPLQGGLPDGRYVVNWTNVSDADGDAAEGAFSFYINYRPNAVDLENDAQLEAIGAEEEETPRSDQTATVQPDSTPSGEGTAPARDTPEPRATSGVPGETTDDNDDGGNAAIWIAVGAIAIVAAAVGVGWFLISRRNA